MTQGSAGRHRPAGQPSAINSTGEVSKALRLAQDIGGAIVRSRGAVDSRRIFSEIDIVRSALASADRAARAMLRILDSRSMPALPGVDDIVKTGLADALHGAHLQAIRFDRSDNRGNADDAIRRIQKYLREAGTHNESLVRALDAAYIRSVTQTANTLDGVVVSGAARGLAAWSARVLPAGERARWRAEWESELYDLAADGQPRRRQVLHAMRVTCRVISLRRAARRPLPEAIQ